jgi:hypothetical protein
MELWSRNGLITVYVKEEESLRKAIELLLQLHSNESHYLCLMPSIVILLKVFEDLLFALVATSHIRVKNEINVFTFVLIPFDLERQELICIQKIDQLLSANLALNSDLIKKPLLNFLRVIVHESVTLLFPVFKRNLFSMELIKHISLQFH